MSFPMINDESKQNGPKPGAEPTASLAAIDFLDRMLTVDEAAEWLRMSVPGLRLKCRGRKPAIPVFRLNARVWLFHPRTILAKLAADAGVEPEVLFATMTRAK